MLMLRDVSTRIGTIASRAARSSLVATGRKKNSTRRSSEAKRMPMRVALRSGDAARLRYASHAVAPAAQTTSARIHQERGFANATLFLRPRQRLVVAGDQARVVVGHAI